MLILAALLAAGAPGCVRDGNQMQLNMCAEQDFERADAQLNVQWRLTLSAFQGGDAADRLRTAQRAWLMFRDAECMAETASSEGGSIHGMDLLVCRARLTQARTHQLADLASGR